MSNQSQYMDFDAFFAETKKEGPTIKLFGQTYELPSEIPAQLMLSMKRAASSNKNSAVPQEDEINMLIALFGENNFDDMCRRGLGLNQMGDILKWSMGVLSGKGSDIGQAKPEEGPGPSSEPTEDKPEGKN